MIEYVFTKITKEEYVDFLKRSDLGSQYPLESFAKRIGTLVENASISLIALDKKKIVGVLFALTDFSYWMFVTDLGVDRNYLRLGIGRTLIELALDKAGGKENIAMYLVANEDAIPFYEKIGMKKSSEVMECNHVKWTSFKVS